MKKIKNDYSENSSLLSSSFIYLVTNIISAAGPFILLPVLTRHLSVNEYGEVAIYQTLLMGMATVIGLAANGAAGVKYHEIDFPESEMSSYIGNCFFIFFWISLLIIVATYLFSEQAAEWLKIPITWIYLSIISAISINIIYVTMTQWQVRRKAINYGIFQVLQSFIIVAFSLIFVINFDLGATGRVLALSFIPILFAVFSFLLLRRENRVTFSYNKKYQSEIMRFGFPLIPHLFGGLILTYADRIIINKELGIGQVGIYIVSVQIVSIMGLFFDSINNAYVPWLYERLKKSSLEKNKSLVLGTYICWIFLIALSVVMFFLAPPLVKLIVSREYHAAAEIVGWLALGQSLNGMYLMVANYIFYSKKTILLSGSTVVAGLTHILLTVILVNQIGIEGAAISFSIAMGLKFFLTWCASYLLFPMPWFDFSRRRKDV